MRLVRDKQPSRYAAPCISVRNVWYADSFPPGTLLRLVQTEMRLNRPSLLQSTGLSTFITPESVSLGASSSGVM
ncbi:hypothetical protein Cob_v006247 [Colletotrichum orbiculare MAFF 240422]|uniref:Uncharacterized protein n=1 Tax=Colletotrichum orbiculare (strain 104-T / ATCC 96160 / CBS 514.97 / LARS 414 / MAFF 240422) TaxID=1213857 RepID=A0A484FSN1_COLOR|nr:hypothetical protein Cob_v006247 [Colletotrichum orbiculare MAFF 240422]